MKIFFVDAWDIDADRLSQRFVLRSPSFEEARKKALECSSYEIDYLVRGEVQSFIANHFPNLEDINEV